MTHHLVQHVRRNAVPYLVCGVVLVLGVGGGYAYAASKTKTITVCADKGTGVLHLKTTGDASAARPASPGTKRARRGRKGFKVPRALRERPR